MVKELDMFKMISHVCSSNSSCGTNCKYYEEDFDCCFFKTTSPANYYKHFSSLHEDAKDLFEIEDEVDLNDSSDIFRKNEKLKESIKYHKLRHELLNEWLELSGHSFKQAEKHENLTYSVYRIILEDGMFKIKRYRNQDIFHVRQEPSISTRFGFLYEEDVLDFLESSLFEFLLENPYFDFAYFYETEIKPSYSDSSDIENS